MESETHRRWRAEDLEQRALDNARFLWNRNVEQNRRDTVSLLLNDWLAKSLGEVPQICTVLQAERAVQLRNLAKLSALVAGFAMASFLQFNFDTSIVQPGVLTGYALVTALVVRLARSLCLPGKLYMMSS